jgi:hypothetical protein
LRRRIIFLKNLYMSISIYIYIYTVYMKKRNKNLLNSKSVYKLTIKTILTRYQGTNKYFYKPKNTDIFPHNVDGHACTVMYVCISLNFGFFY